MYRKLIANCLFVFALVVGWPAFAGYPSQFPSITTGTYPLPDQSVAPAYIWIEQGCSTNPSNCDFSISPQQLGYPQQSTTSPSTPYLYQPWWNKGTGQYELYDGSQWIPNFALDTANHVYEGVVGGGVLATIAGNTTTDLCAGIPQSDVVVSGSATVASFGSTCPAGIIKFVTFSGNATLQQNSTSMQLPGNANIATATGDSAIVQALGSANYKVLTYTTAATGCLSCVSNPSAALTGTPTAPTAASGTSTTQIATTAFVANAIYQKLSANLTLYVSPSGSDTNNPCVSSSTPCATFQNAFNTARNTYNLNGNTLTIQEVNCGGGSMSISTSLSGLLPGQAGADNLVIMGNTSNPDSCIITSTTDAFHAQNGAAFTIEGFKISALGDDVSCTEFSVCKIGYIDFGAVTNFSQISVIHHGLAYVFANLTISGGAGLTFANAADGSVLFLGATGSALSSTGTGAWTPITVSLIGTPAFGSAFIASNTTSDIETGPSGNVTFTGSATGVRYSTGNNGVILTNLSSPCPATYFPGSTSGANVTGGQCN